MPHQDPKQQLVERIGNITVKFSDGPFDGEVKHQIKRLPFSKAVIEALASAWLEDLENAKLAENHATYNAVDNLDLNGVGHINNVKRTIASRGRAIEDQLAALTNKSKDQA